MKVLHAAFIILVTIFSATSLAECKSEPVVAAMIKNGYVENSDLLLTCKPMPNNPDSIIIAYSKLLSPVSHEYQLLVFVLDLKSGLILGKHIDSEPSFGADGDPVDISIDTAPYNVSKSQRAFGIRVTHQLNSWDSTTDISLYLLIGNELRQVLKNIAVDSRSYHLCNGYNFKSLIVITEKQRNNFNVLLIKSQEETTDGTLTESGDCINPQVNRANNSREYIYDEGIYKDL